MLAVGPNKLLLAASIGDHQEINKLITEEGLSPSHVYPRGVTALHEAAEAGHVEAVKLLIEKGVDINKQVCMQGQLEGETKGTPLTTHIFYHTHLYLWWDTALLQ